MAFIDGSGQLALWHLPVPKHYPNPVDDSVPLQAAPTTDRVILPSETVGVATDLPSDVHDVVDDGSDEMSAAVARRRLRKVLHDSDDGGFSDHDDDEAAEAALLAAQIKRHGACAFGEATVNEIAIAGDAARTQMLASRATAGPGVAAQPPLYPSNTPVKNGRRFLLWNLTGMVLTRDENVFSAIEAPCASSLQPRTTFLRPLITTFLHPLSTQCRCPLLLPTAPSIHLPGRFQ